MEAIVFIIEKPLRHAKRWIIPDRFDYAAPALSA